MKRKPKTASNPGGRPTLGAERKKVYTVMLEPAVAERLRKLGGDNLSRGIALAAEAKRS